jgi:YD repeat-containing protein
VYDGTAEHQSERTGTSGRGQSGIRRADPADLRRDRNRPYQITTPPAATGGQAGITALAWDDQGNQLSSIDATGAQTLSTYDVAERLST